MKIKYLFILLPSERDIKFYKIMRTTVFFLFIFVFQIMATNIDAQNTKISVKTDQVSLRQLINEIENQTNYYVVYSRNEIDLEQNLKIRNLSCTVKEMLDDAFVNSSLSYRFDNNYIILKKQNDSMVSLSTLQDGGKEIKGTIRDILNEPLIGATVTVKGTTHGTVTDVNGNFSIKINPGDILLVSYIGYSPQEINTENKTLIDIVLQEDSQDLDEVVIIAYGNTTQRKFTGALQTVNSEKIAEIPVPQITQKLQGKFAGVRINQATGRLGEGLSVQVRGAASISTASSPLYVVDGFPITGSIVNINPNEIESITVLKDAASTSLYGSRAAFGVVLINTKTAKIGKTEISANVYTGFQQVPQKGRPDVMNGTEWAQFKKESYEDRGIEVPVAFQNPVQYGDGHDWYDAMLRTGIISDYSVTIIAGKDQFSSSIVAGFFNQKGVLLNSDYKRYSIRANNVFQISDRLKAGFNIAPTFSTGNTPPSDGQFFSGGGLLLNAALTPPVLAYQNEDGTYPVTVTTPDVTSFPTPNWIRSARDITNTMTGNWLLANGYVEYEVMKDLKLKASIGTDIGQALRHYFQPSTAGRAFAVAPSAANANLAETNDKYWSWLSENTVTYTKKINNHNFDLLGGFTAQKFRSDGSSFSGFNFADDRIQTINAALVKNNPTMDIQEWSMLSYIGRLNYDYKGKYLLSASIREDGSSRFGSDNKWGSFPAVSAAWVITEENYAKNLDWLSFFKVRASYGITGNNNIGNYTQYNTVSNSNAVFNNSAASGVAVTGMGNTELGWENTKDFNVGFDMNFFNGRVSLNYDYYNKTTDNLLYRLAIPNESGFSSFMGNVGKVQFWGHELTISSNNLTGPFKWTTDFNISTSDNKVKALSAVSDSLFVTTGFVTTITRVGGRIGQFYGLVQDGVYVDQADYDNSPKYVDSQVGTIKWRDINNDGEITVGNSGGDKTEIGNPYPKFIFGFTNNFSYKNFDLSVVTTGSYGNKIAAAIEQGYTNLDGVFNVLKDVKDRWRSPSNPGAGKYGKTTGATGPERDHFHSRFVYDGSYISIKNITLGYEVPPKFLKYINGVRIYASIQDAFVFTKYKYGNPDVNVNFDGNLPSSTAMGIDYSAYPIPRTITFGLNVSLK
ncbi:MAG: SusC/RagA family TonB-linked outer membrane protein [Bacteroidia bacterium 44-10]|nr:MAG: SusC/RagA family TonB-linked outer membrane protein [Bacteroidia bacterium 44-10]